MSGTDDTVAGSPYTAEAAAAAPALIAGRYQIVRWIGGGGMGRVYEVLDTELGERVALKMLKGDLDDETLTRFRREVRLTRRIQHPNIARMYDIGETGDDNRFLTMELIEGEPLTAALGKPLPWLRLQKIAVQICAGLTAAHDKGVVHRDLKPDNVLVEKATERVVITDFGIARGTDDAQGNVTQTGMMIGTPRYMPPEQLAGRATDARSDLFSLGVMLYELASGGRPWSGDNPIAIAVAQATQPMQPLVARGAPSGFVAIVEQMLSIDPARRPTSAAEVGAAIAALASTPTIEAPEVSLSVRAVAPAPAEHEVAIAVLPFAHAGDDEDLATGMREDLTDMLSTTPGLRVRPAAMVERGSDPRESGRALGVDHVVIGSLRRIPTGLRVAARLVGVADGFQIWAHRIDCTEVEVLAIGDQLGRAIADALSTRVTHRHALPTDPRVVELFLRARAELRRFWGDHAETATSLLEQAAHLAPTSAPIAGLLACASVLAWAKQDRPELLVRARQHVERGVALDHPEAYLGASTLHWNLGELEASVRDLRIGLDRAPMSALAHETAARVLVEIDPGPAGRRHFETALALDPSREEMIGSDLARLDAFDGNWAMAEQRTTALCQHSDRSMQQFGLMTQLRLFIWRGDVDETERLLSAEGLRLPTLGSEIGLLIRQWRERGSFDQAIWDRAMVVLSAPNRPRRLQLAILQRATELAAMLGQHAHATQALRLSSERGLADIVWVDRCPILSGIQDPAWRAVRDEVAARASRVLALYNATTRS